MKYAAMVIIDTDLFKGINATYAYPPDDAGLKEIVLRILLDVADSDIVVS